MKRIYSFLTLAVMFFGAALTANAEESSVVFEATSSYAYSFPVGEYTPTGATSLTSGDLTFSLDGMPQSYHFGSWGLGTACPYKIEKQNGEGNTLAYINVEGLEDGQSMSMTITIEGACQAFGAIIGDGHNCPIISTSDGEKTRIHNSGTELGYETYSLTTTNFKNGDQIVFYNGGGTCCIRKITISYDVVENKTYYVTPENELFFLGEWDAEGINEVIAANELSYTEVISGEKEDEYEFVTTEVPADKLGAIDVTNVESSELAEITVANPNTIIFAGLNQTVSNESNVVIGRECANLVITDPLTEAGAQVAGNYSEVDCGYYCGREFIATKASYARPMSSKYATVVIPFSFDPAAQDATIMDVTNISEAGVEVDPTEYEEIAFGRPFVAKVADGDLVITAENTKVAGSYGAVTSMYGVYTEITLGEGDYYIAQDAFWNASSCEEDVILKPFRCFFDLPEVNAVKLAIKENATAIKNAQIANEEVPAYNLQGIRVAANAKGFVLMNGKKYFNK